MYTLFFFRRMCKFHEYYYKNKNEAECIRISRLLKEYCVGFLYVLCLGFLDIVNCASGFEKGDITFALIDLNWEVGIHKNELSKVKYWLSRSNENEKFECCPGKHNFKSSNVNMANLVCSTKRSYQNHKPLRSFEIYYKETWKIQFRILDRFLFKASDENPFLFNISMDVNCQEFEMFVKLLTFDPGFTSLNITYNLFYKFLRLIDTLDPISSENLNKLYSHLYKKCFLGIGFIDIMADQEHYRQKYFEENHRIRAFMPFFSVLSDSINACFDPEKSCLSLFKKTKHSSDQCFREAINVSRLILKISTSSLELLLSGFKAHEWSVFNWLLSVTKISCFYIDDTELTSNEMKLRNICGFVNRETLKRSPVPPKTISSDLFLYLSDTNMKSIQYFKFVNVVIPLDYLVQNFDRASISYFEASYCSTAEYNKVTVLLEKMKEPNAWKLTGFKLDSDDIYRILYSNIKILVLKDCTLDVKAEWKPLTDGRGDFKLSDNLKSLDISLSDFPICLVQIFLMSSKLEKIFLNSFKFTGSFSFNPFLNIKRILDCFEAEEYIPNECLKAYFSEDVTVNSLCLSRISDFERIRFFFGCSGLHNSVRYLDLSKNSLTVDSLNLISNFYKLKHLNLSRSLPSSMEGLIHSRYFEDVTHLDVSHNSLFLPNAFYISWFKNLKALDMSGVKMGCDILSLILAKELSYLDISGVDLSLADFKCISGCRNLQKLIFSYGNSCPLTTYCDVLKATNLRERLTTFGIETTGNVDMDDVLSLAEFPNLLEVKIACRTIINERKRELFVFNYKNPNFRIQFALKIPFTDTVTQEIFKDLFRICYFSFIYE